MASSTLVLSSVFTLLVALQSACGKHVRSVTCDWPSVLACKPDGHGPYPSSRAAQEKWCTSLKQTTACLDALGESCSGSRIWDDMGGYLAHLKDTLASACVAAKGETCPEAVERHSAECGGPGCFIPRCDGDYWAAVQHRGAGSECVSKEGKPIEGYGWRSGFDTDCRCARDQHESQDVASLCQENGSYMTCQAARKKAKDACPPPKSGCYIPDCEEGTTFYNATQYIGSGTKCVTNEGKTIAGYEFIYLGFQTDCQCARATHLGLDVNCDWDGSFAEPLTCPNAQAKARVVCNGRVGCSSPNCDGDVWAAVQYEGAGGYCVTKAGHRIVPFAWQFGDVDYEGKGESDCKCARAQAYGENISCNSDGSHIRYMGSK